MIIKLITSECYERRTCKSGSTSGDSIRGMMA